LKTTRFQIYNLKILLRKYKSVLLFDMHEILKLSYSYGNRHLTHLSLQLGMLIKRKLAKCNFYYYKLINKITI